MAYVSTPGLHEEFAQPNAAAPAALHFQEELARLNAAEPAALQGGSQEPTVEVTMSPPPDFQAQLHEAYLKGLAAGNPSAATAPEGGTPGLAQYFTPQVQGPTGVGVRGGAQQSPVPPAWPSAGRGTPHVGSPAWADGRGGMGGPGGQAQGRGANNLAGAGRGGGGGLGGAGSPHGPGGAFAWGSPDFGAMKCRAALAPPALQALALGQVEAQELELARVNDETSKGTYDYLLRAGFQASKPTSTFSAGTAEANARPSLIAHVRDISRYLVSNGLLLLQHASRALDVVLSSFHGEAKTTMRELVETAETTCTGHFMERSPLYVALDAMLKAYELPRAAALMEAEVSRFRWKSSVHLTKQAFETLWKKAVQVAMDTADNSELERFSAPEWSGNGGWLKKVLKPQFPTWVMDLRIMHERAFDNSDTFWKLLETAEPPWANIKGLHALGEDDAPDEDAAADAGSLFSLARNGKPISCYRCGEHHFLRECLAAPSAEERQGLPQPWPRQQPHPSQMTRQVPRPEGAPVPYERPGGGATVPGAQTFVTGLNALPGEDIGRRFQQLEQGQAQLTTMLAAALSRVAPQPQQELPQPQPEPVLTLAKLQQTLARLASAPVDNPVTPATVLPREPTKVGVGLPAAVPEPLLTLPAPVSSSPAFLVAASAPPDYTPVGVTRVEETGARGETLWARNDLLESSMPGGLPKN